MEKYGHTQCRQTPPKETLPCYPCPSVQSPTTLKRPSPTNQAHVYGAILHQTSITYREMRTYPVQMGPPLSKPKCTEPNYMNYIYIQKNGPGPPLIKHTATEPDYTICFTYSRMLT